MPKKTTRTGAETALGADIEHLENQKQAKPSTAEPTNKQKGRPRKPDSRRSGVKAGTHAHLNVIVTSDLHQQVAIAAVTSKKDMSEIVEDALKKYLKSK